MTIIFTIIFLLSIAGGAAWGYINNLTITGYLMSLAVAGFIGSAVIALIFSYLYFYQEETDQDKIKRLRHEINDLKEIKRIEP